jgi:hypothetical protein
MVLPENFNRLADIFVQYHVAVKLSNVITQIAVVVNNIQVNLDIRHIHGPYQRFEVGENALVYVVTVVDKLVPCKAFLIVVFQLLDNFLH